MRLFLLLALVCSATAAESLPDVRVERALGGLTFKEPVALVQADAGRWLVVERQGTIRLVVPGASEAPLFLDLRDRVSAKQLEEGLLALALHPQWASNGRFYVWYTSPEPRRDVLATFTLAPGSRDRADPATGAELLTIDDPYWNHNGSALVFGPDGFLYLSPGDGGGGGDPLGAGQRLDTLLAKILRIDVDRTDAGLPYAIPADNPFVGKAGARGEIWAYGIRNVWRMSFDRVGGELWAGDVGQNAWEEIDVIVKGGNYGWNRREGAHDFKAGPGGPYIEPVTEYGRELGISVTGGHVYRGKAIPGLVGAYVYGDFQSGRIWGLRRREGQSPMTRQIAWPRNTITTFAEDAEGELYYASFDGAVWKLIP